MNPHVRRLEYAVRGPIVQRAMELENEMNQGKTFPFKEVIKCNIGDCHAMGQKPITFIRQVAALLAMPELQNDPNIPRDAKERAQSILGNCGGSSVVSSQGPITIDNMNPHAKRLEYAVRGPIVQRALELENELKKGKSHPFKEVIKCNIGDCHAMGQKPITFIRQVAALLAMPEMQNNPNFPSDAKQRAKRILESCGGGSIGSYSQSTGVEIIRQDCAKFISERDGIPSESQDIFVSNGASEAIKSILQILSTQKDGKDRAGVMIPIPQYPLYSATNAEYNAYQIGYFLEEDQFWGLSEKELERAINEAKDKCHPRAIVIINPGNPTGQVLTRDDIEMVIRFAKKHNLLIMADEVYQFNIYAENRTFISMKKALHEMGAEYNKSVTLASFMSTSKGYMGECGFRGGYCELINWDGEVKAQLYKCLSARLCSSVIGQGILDVVVNCPKKGEPSYELFEKEKNKVLSDLKAKGKLVSETFNSLPGFKCNSVQGAMYAFPKIELPPKVIAAAKALNYTADFFYCLNLLEQTGVCVVPGSGFGQKEGTFHFRITILPPVEKMQTVMKLIKEFHLKFMEKYK